MTRVDLGALAIMFWIMSLFSVLMTAAFQRRGRRTLLEKAYWKRARRRAQERREDLEGKIAASSIARMPDSITMDFLQREDMLAQASSWAFKIRIIVPSVLAFNAGGALWAVALDADWSGWREFAAFGMLFAPTLITVALNLMAMGPGMQRWTTDIVTFNGRRAYKALLTSFVVEGQEPRPDEPFHSPHISACRALEDFALALEKYGTQRALPDGSNPMPRVVAQYSAAAVHVRRLRDEVELDREDGRKQALLEVERMLTVLASPRLRELAPVSIETDELLNGHRDRKNWRRRTLTLAIFTLTFAGFVAALVVSSPALGIAVAGAGATFVVTSWGRSFGLQQDEEEGSRRGS